MSQITNNAIFKKMEEWAPQSLGYDWDNNGLQVGAKTNPVKNVLISLDVLEKTVDEAIENNIDLIVAHHPLLFKGLKQIDFETPKGRTLKKLIENNISVYAAHTNLDIADGGVNDMIAEKLAIKNTKPLVNTKSTSLFKVVVYVPKDHLSKVKAALSKAGAGEIGNYSHCSFETIGQGQFKPSDEANPHSGTRGELFIGEEVKLEVIVTEDKLNKAVDQMKNAHPYEEVAYDTLKLENKDKTFGIGRIGCLKKEISVQLLCKQIKEKLNVDRLRVSGDLNKKVQKIAVLGGSGEKYIHDAFKQKADVLITGDITFHLAQEAIELGIVVIDAGHYIEEIMKESVKDYLETSFSNDSINFLVSKENTNPFTFI